MEQFARKARLERGSGSERRGVTGHRSCVRTAGASRPTRRDILAALLTTGALRPGPALVGPREGVKGVPNDKTCIYCPQTDRSRFRGVEHVIPQAFGRFGSETPTLDCVCDDCNAYFGRELDQLLARETYEGISRYSRGQFSRDARPQKRVSLSLADPAEAGDCLGLRVAVDGTNGRLMPITVQFHVHNFRTGTDEGLLPDPDRRPDLAGGGIR